LENGYVDITVEDNTEEMRDESSEDEGQAKVHAMLKRLNNNTHHHIEEEEEGGELDLVHIRPEVYIREEEEEEDVNNVNINDVEVELDEVDVEGLTEGDNLNNGLMEEVTLEGTVTTGKGVNNENTDNTDNKDETALGSENNEESDEFVTPEPFVEEGEKEESLENKVESDVPVVAGETADDVIESEAAKEVVKEEVEVVKEEVEVVKEEVDITREESEGDMVTDDESKEQGGEIGEMSLNLNTAVAVSSELEESSPPPAVEPEEETILRVEQSKEDRPRSMTTDLEEVGLYTNKYICFGTYFKN